ncbi:MAG TPA: hypothetical protein VGL42_12315 [Opitutaceae bacterium]
MSARFHVHIALEANAKSPITGDFSQLTLNESLDLAAKEAGMDVIHLGTKDSDGFVLKVPKVADRSAALEDAARRRAELLKERSLLDHANNSQAGSDHAD